MAFELGSGKRRAERATAAAPDELECLFAQFDGLRSVRSVSAMTVNQTTQAISLVALRQPAGLPVADVEQLRRLFQRQHTNGDASEYFGPLGFV
jgi:hypothetical protein